MDEVYLELFKGAQAKCEKCGSQNLMLFVESRIKDCVAWACNDCKTFEIRGKQEEINQFFKDKNESKAISG